MYNLLILRISRYDMPFLCPIGTEESGMGAMVSAPNDDAKKDLEKKRNNGKVTNSYVFFRKQGYTLVITSHCCIDISSNVKTNINKIQVRVFADN